MRFITSRSPVKPQVVAESNQKTKLCTARCKGFNQVRGTYTRCIYRRQALWRVHGHNRGVQCPFK